MNSLEFKFQGQAKSTESLVQFSFTTELGIRRDGSDWDCMSGAVKNKRQSRKNRMTSRPERGKSLRHRSQNQVETAPQSPSKEFRTEKRSRGRNRRENVTEVGRGAGQEQGQDRGAEVQHLQGGRQSRGEDPGLGTEAGGSIRVVVVVEVVGTGRGHDHDPAKTEGGAGVDPGAQISRVCPHT